MNGVTNDEQALLLEPLELGVGKQMNSDLPRIITRKELRLIVPYSPQHILRLEKRGKFPKRVQLGARRVGWYLAEVETWLGSRTRGPLSRLKVRRAFIRA